jgi:acyl-CoA reductase-like NAD-dependent aldehyde dehydrogenase
VPVAERARLQGAFAALMRRDAEAIGRTLSAELGRPLDGAITEVTRSADLMDYFAQEGLRVRGELTGDGDERVAVTQEPLGVVIAIAPFNYPITLLLMKVGAALVTGNTVVAKPAQDTPLSTLHLARLFAEAGYPAGVVNVVTGRGRELGEALVGHPLPAKVAFTGSTAAGIRIRQLAAETNKRVTLELGGQSPAIVCADATHEMRVMTEETFGPVVGIAPFDTLDEAVALANDSRYGLAAYVFSRDLGVAWRTADELEAGSVWVNDIHRSLHSVPFGGVKQSGLGREKSRHGLDAYLEFKTTYLAR